MAASTLTMIRREMAKRVGIVDYDKATINATVQAVDAWLDDNKAAVNAVIEGVAPGVFTVPQKKVLVALTLIEKLRLDL